MMIILLLVCAVLFLMILNRISRYSQRIDHRLDILENLLNERYQQVEKPAEQEYAPAPVGFSHDPVEKTEVNDVPVFTSQPGYVFEMEQEDPYDVLGQPALALQEEYAAPESFAQARNEGYVSYESWWDKFKTRNPDLEKFIGENLISKIGITILVLGIAFFVKYAIDKDWINEVARVGIGILCGALVNFVAHRLLHKFKAFSSVLVAGAIAIYYFTIAIAFQEYHLFSQGVAFSLMVVITAFSLLVSISYNRQELALLSLIGGFSTPLMVSTGEGNYIVLFTYLLILDAGMMVLAYLRKWVKVNIATFVFTLLFFCSWVSLKVYHVEGAPVAGALIFATLYYFVFTIMILINDLRAKRNSGNLELTMFLSNTAVYYAVGMLLISTSFPSYKGLFTVAMALVNMVIGWLLYKRFDADKKIIYLLAGLALTFVTLAAPVQLDGNRITLFWAAESVLLLWLSLKSELRNFLLSSIIVFILMILSLLTDWFQYYTGIVQADLPLIFNPLFLTGMFACACLFVQILLLKKQTPQLQVLSLRIDLTSYRTLLKSVAIILLYFVCQIELNYQVEKRISSGLTVNIILCAFHMLYCTTLTIYCYYQDKALRFIAYTSALINVMAFAVIMSSMHLMALRNMVIDHTFTILPFNVHLAGLACFTLLVIYLYKMKDHYAEELEMKRTFMSWLLAILIVYVSSAELMLLVCHHGILSHSKHMMYMTDFNRLQLQVIKTGFPILWSFLSIIFLVAGIRRQDKDLRIFSLVLQAVTIVKLFTFDITNVSEAGKIVAFIILGVILLIMSFMYQKIKAIIFSDEKTEQP